MTTPALPPPPPPPPPLSTLPKSNSSDYYEDYDDTFAQTNKTTHNISYYKSDTCDNLKEMLDKNNNSNTINNQQTGNISTISRHLDDIYANNKTNYDAVFSNYQNANVSSLSTFGKSLNQPKNSSMNEYRNNSKLKFDTSIISQSYENKNISQLSNSYLNKPNYYNNNQNDANNTSKIFPRTNPNYSKIYGIKSSSPEK